MSRDGPSIGSGGQTDPGTIRADLERYLVAGHDSSAKVWLEKLSDAQILEHGPGLLETFRRWYDCGLPHPDAVIDHRNNDEGQRLAWEKITFTLFLYFKEIRQRLSQPGLKRHGWTIFDLYLTGPARSEEALCDAIAEKTGLAPEEAKRQFEAVWEQLHLVLKQAIKDGNFP